MLAEISSGMRSLLFPSACAGCGAGLDPGLEEGWLCGRCRAALPWLRELETPRAFRPPLDFDAALALWRHEGPARELVRALKYRGAMRLAPRLAGLLAGAARSRWGEGFADAVTCVPMHSTRLRERTFNQAEMLAVPIARELGLPYRSGLLARVLPTRAQPGLSPQERSENVRWAFRAGPGAAPSRVLLIDDVLTTGATASACARTLKGAGAERVLVAALARGG